MAKVKRKGRYDYELDWHKDHSALVVQKAAEANLIHGTPVTQFIQNHTDIYDFLLRTKVPRSGQLVTVDYKGVDYLQQNVSRYYISHFGANGGDLIKILPPTPAQVKKDINAPKRRIGINAGWKATICNNVSEIFPDDIEWEWYICQALKLTEPIRKGGVR